MKKFLVFLCAMLFFFGFAGIASATLWDRGGGLIYDDVLDITWLQDANYAGTAMNWATAVAWADTLSYYDSVRDVYYDDWRLPTTVNCYGSPWDPSIVGYDGTKPLGYNIISSEMGYMYYENLGDLGYGATDGTYPQAGWGLNNTGPFDNLQPGTYWSGTESAAYPGLAWIFGFNDGYQAFAWKDLGYYAWAVRPGDVSAPVPEPATMLLLGSGLAGLGIFRSKVRRRHG